MNRRLCLAGRIDGEEAARRFAKPRLANLYGLFSKSINVAVPDRPETRVTPFVERLWLPAYAVLLKTGSRQTRKDVWTSVDALSGHFSLLDCFDELAEHDLHQEHFPPLLDEQRATEIARAGLMRYILGQRGQINKPVVETVENIRVFYYPVFVCYYRRWFGKRLDIKVLDACSGKPAGARVRASIINALVARHKLRR